ncbi:MAG: BREX-2 system phosphatase PglZ, partial [Candidatus Tectomicrobia bacterium]
MTMGPTPEQVATQVAMIRRQRPEERVIGIHTPGTWLGGAELKVDRECLPVVCCASALHISEALMSHDTDGPPLVIITNLEDGHLSLDVLARLAGRRLCHIDRWQIVRDCFRARQLDPRLPAQGWLADALLQHMPEGGYPPVASGLLDADTVWTHLLQQHLGLPSGRPDAVALVTWSLSVDNLRRYEALHTEFRAGLRQRLEGTAGAVGVAMLDALDAGHGAWLLPIGLVCEILYASDGRRQMGIAQARARLEPYVAGRTLSSEIGRAWFEAAQAALVALPDAEARACLDRAQQLLTDLKATAYQALSSVLASGLNQRLGKFAEVLTNVLNGKSTIDELEASVEYVQSHKAAEKQADRMARVLMALRLARYLESMPQATQSASLSQMSVAYTEHGGYVDWARQVLSAGDETQKVAKAFGLLAERIRQVREQQNKRFAALLADWSKGPSPSPSENLIPIEQALSRIVARIAEVSPTLLLVIDGMGYAVFRELSDDLRQRGWMEL